MPAKGVIAFTNDGFLLSRQNNYTWQAVPKKLGDRLAARASVIYCAAFGPNENFFCAWKEKGSNYYLYNVDKYPQLQEFLNDANRKKKFKAETFHCSLGPDGAFYIHNGGGGQFHRSLDPKLSRELSRRLTAQGLWNFDPSNVALGVGGSYVLVGKKGDIFWDLKGHYGNLDRLLRESKEGIKTITLSPFNGSYYFVLFASMAKWQVGPGWNVNPWAK